MYSIGVCIYIELQPINNANPGKINEFYEKLTTHVQVLETMGKIKSINGYVRVLVDKLSEVTADLVRNDENWKEWEFPEWAFRRWAERNIVSTEYMTPRSQIYQTDQTFEYRNCVKRM